MIREFLLDLSLLETLIRLLKEAGLLKNNSIGSMHRTDILSKICLLVLERRLYA
jgi:hypothetical protein